MSRGAIHKKRRCCIWSTQTRSNQSFQRGHKTQFVRSGCQHADILGESSSDIDHDLLTIRERLSKIGMYEDNFHFYAGDLQAWWRIKDQFDPSRWNRLIRWTWPFVNHAYFVQLELDSRLEVAAHLQLARSKIADESTGWSDALKQACLPNLDLTIWPVYSAFLEWCSEHHGDARNALRTFWKSLWTPVDTQASIEEATRRFLEKVPQSVACDAATRVSLAAFLAMGIDPHRFPGYMAKSFEDGYWKTGHSPPEEGFDEAAVYQHALEFLDTFAEEASVRGLELRDRLTAQSALWWVLNSGDYYREVLPGEEHKAFLTYREADPPPPRPTRNPSRHR